MVFSRVMLSVNYSIGILSMPIDTLYTINGWPETRPEIKNKNINKLFSRFRFMIVMKVAATIDLLNDVRARY